MTTDRDFRVRQEARNAIARLVLDGGGQMVRRPLVRSEPLGVTTLEPEPLPGIAAAVAFERAARSQCLESIRYAREDGVTWAQIGEALGYRDNGADDPPAERAYRYAVPGHAAGDWLTWTCPSCHGRIRDYGPYSGPADAEEGHEPGCARLAAEVTGELERRTAGLEDGSEEGERDA